MISVSSGFKNAIKNENREIYGYVEVKYQNDDYDLEVLQTPNTAEIVISDGLVNEGKVLKKFASLEDNYTLLDGSFMVWNENRPLEYGFISDDVFEDINDSTIIIQNNTPNTLVKGITIYFKENLPFDFDFTLTYSDNTTETHNIRNNTSMTYQYMFSEEMSVSTITLEILRVEKPENRLRVAGIDFNISDLYEGDELVSFDVDEEIDLLLTNVPTNTCSINVNNYPSADGGNKFDPINPRGITNYLTNNATLEPYIGVLTEENGIEYVKMGTFYISDWSSDSDGNVTINGKSLMDKLTSQQLHSDGTFCYNNNYYWTSSALSYYLTNTTDYEFDLSFPYDIISNEVLKHMEIMDYLRMIAMCGQEPTVNRILKIGRDNVVKMSDIILTPVDSIPRNLLVEDAKYTINEPIRYLNFTAMKNANNSSSTTKDVLNLSYSLNSTDEYLWIEIDNNLISYSPSFPKTFTYTKTGSGTATLVDVNDRLAYIHFVGAENETFTLHLTTNIFAVDGNITTTIKNANNGETISVDVSEYFRINEGAKRQRICKGILNLRKKYHVALETMGDPSLELGDTISIQTRYQDINDGYKDIIITKQRFSYDGGLSCTIEGEGD